MNSSIENELKNCRCEPGETYHCAEHCDKCDDELCELHVGNLECEEPGCKTRPTVVGDDLAHCSTHAVDAAFEHRGEWWPEWEALAGSDAGEGVAAVLNAASAAWRSEYEGGLELEGLELYPDANGRACFDESDISRGGDCGK